MSGGVEVAIVPKTHLDTPHWRALLLLTGIAEKGDRLLKQVTQELGLCIFLTRIVAFSPSRAYLA